MHRIGISLPIGFVHDMFTLVDAAERGAQCEADMEAGWSRKPAPEAKKRLTASDKADGTRGLFLDRRKETALPSEEWGKNFFSRVLSLVTP